MRSPNENDLGTWVSEEFKQRLLIIEEIESFIDWSKSWCLLLNGRLVSIPGYSFGQNDRMFTFTLYNFCLSCCFRKGRIYSKALRLSDFIIYIQYISSLEIIVRSVLSRTLSTPNLSFADIWSQYQLCMSFCQTLILANVMLLVMDSVKIWHCTVRTVRYVDSR